MLLWIFILFTISVCTLFWLSQRRTRLLLAGLPSFPQLPFIGNYHQFSGGSRVLYQRMCEISKIIEITMKPFAIWLGPCPILVVTDPEDVKVINNTFIGKPYYYSFMCLWLGDGIFTAPAPLWKKNIKKLAGTFTIPIVNGYQDIFNEQARKLINKFKEKVDSGPFDVFSDLSYTSLEAICQSALGVESITDSIVTEKYNRALHRCLELLINRTLNLIQHLDFIYRLTPSYREMMKSVATVQNVSKAIMEKRRLYREEKKYNEKSNSKFKSYFDILLDMQKLDPNLTEKQIKSELDTIIFAGQETVATVLFFCFQMIGANKKVQDKLYAEFKNIFGDTKRKVNTDDLNRMCYCEAVINETLRLFPPAPLIMRYADKELQLKSCTVPIGTACWINIWGAGRSPRAWGPDATLFRPGRWLEESPCSRSPASFIPFSYGRRACIGKKYAAAILKTILAHCIREFELESKPDEMELAVDIVLKPISTNLIRLKLRE